METAGPGPASLSTASVNQSEPLDWQFLQCFGERTPGEKIQEGEERSNSRSRKRPLSADHRLYEQLTSAIAGC